MDKNTDEFVVVNIENTEGFQSSEGVIKPLVFGEKVSSICLEIPPHFEITPHSHTQETVIYCIEGSFTRTAGGITKAVGPGDVYLIPGGVKGGIKTGEKAARVIACSSPAVATSREELLERLAKNASRKKHLQQDAQQDTNERKIRRRDH